MSSYQEIEKILSVLSALALQKDAESAEKLAAGIDLLNKDLKTFFATKPKLERNEIISLFAKIDSLHVVAKKKSAEVKKSIIDLNKRLQAEKGYKGK
jgi:hypothetical protein